MKGIKILQLKKDYPFAEKIVNIPGGPSLSNYEIYDRIIRTLDSSKRFEKYLLWDVGNIKLISLVPSSAIGKLVDDHKYLCHYFYEEVIYSVILGYFIIQDSNSEFRFFGSPEQLIKCYNSFALTHELHHSYDPGFHDFPCFIEFSIPEYNDFLAFVKTKLEIPTSITTCQDCGISISEYSTEEIVISNPGIDLFSGPESFHCPFCSNQIKLNESQSDILSSISVYNTFNHLNTIKEQYIPLTMEIILCQSLYDNHFYKTHHALVECLCQTYLGLSSQVYFKVIKCFPNLLHGLADSSNDEYQRRYIDMDLNEVIQEATLLARGYKINKIKETILNRQDQ